jgi:hypothetical protein
MNFILKIIFFHRIFYISPLPFVSERILEKSDGQSSTLDFSLIFVRFKQQPV